MTHLFQKPKKVAAAVALLAATTAALGCGGGGEPATSATAMSVEPIRVEVATAEMETVPFATQASGTVEAIRRVSPGTKILGRVDRVAVRAGDRVEHGQLLARLESRDLEAAVARAEAVVRRVEAQDENARVHHTRMLDLHGRGSVTDKSLEDATTAYRVAAAAVAQAAADLTAARVSLGYAEVTSPLTGWVVAKRTEAGDMTVPGAPLFTVEDLSRVKVDVSVPETEVIGLTEGGVAWVEILDRRLETTIDRVVPAGDPASRTFSVHLVLDNPDGALKSGMFARVSFEHGERQTLRVPSSAVIRRGQLEGLFVVGDDDRARLRWIKTGRSSGGRAEILSGLDSGEGYVVSPPAGLGDGAAVETVP